MLSNRPLLRLVLSPVHFFVNFRLMNDENVDEWLKRQADRQTGRHACAHAHTDTHTLIG